MSIGDARTAWQALSPAEQWHCIGCAAGDVHVLRARLSHAHRCLLRMHDARRVVDRSAVLLDFRRFSSELRTTFELRGEALFPGDWLGNPRREGPADRATETEKKHTEDNPE
jgi:hypothetical protein